MSDTVEFIHINLNKSAAAELGVVLAIAMNKITGAEVDDDEVVSSLRNPKSFGFIAEVQEKLAAFCGKEMKEKDMAHVRFNPDGGMTTMKEIEK